MKKWQVQFKKARCVCTTGEAAYALSTHHDVEGDGEDER